MSNCKRESMIFSASESGLSVQNYGAI